MVGHLVPTKIYFRVFISLLFLTGLTTGAAYVDLDKFLGLTHFPMNTAVALGIAAVKASLVALFFMHVKYISHLTRIVGVAALFWLAILMTFTLSDYFTRNRHIPNPPQSWHATASQPYR